jgi:hypothetical protein
MLFSYAVSPDFPPLPHTCFSQITLPLENEHIKDQIYFTLFSYPPVNSLRVPVIYTLKLEAANSSKTSVTFYQTAWNHIPEEGNLCSDCSQNLRSHTEHTISLCPTDQYCKCWNSVCSQSSSLEDRTDNFVLWPPENTVIIYGTIYILTDNPSNFKTYHHVGTGNLKMYL